MKTRKNNRLFNTNPKQSPPERSRIGYGTAKKARNSIKFLRGASKGYKRQMATRMYYRAKYHKYQTANMRNSMKVWKKYLQTL